MKVFKIFLRILSLPIILILLIIFLLEASITILSLCILAIILDYVIGIPWKYPGCYSIKVLNFLTKKLKQ